jgi:hypothetical protein
MVNLCSYFNFATQNTVFNLFSIGAAGSHQPLPIFEFATSPSNSKWRKLHDILMVNLKLWVDG